MTYTYALLEISAEAYDEIAEKLREAGYDHAFHDDRDEDGVVIDMHGIALKRGEARESIDELRAEVASLRRLLWTPENEDFAAGVVREAGHQVERWGVEHDACKEPQDWFWLIGYLAGKALRAAIDGNHEKAKHHCISTAAVCANWHSQINQPQGE